MQYAYWQLDTTEGGLLKVLLVLFLLPGGVYALALTALQLGRGRPDTFFVVIFAIASYALLLYGLLFLGTARVPVL